MTVNVDGGARGNPGPAAIAAIVRDEDGNQIVSRGEAIGDTTNNVAEYRAALLGIELAAEVGADEIEIIGDSELIVRQVNGQYKVKDNTLRGYHRAIHDALADFSAWQFTHVKRAKNVDADALVNSTLDEA